MKSIAASLGALAAASTVAAHGYVSSALIGGTNYTGYLPYTDPYTSPTPQRIIRAIPGNGPVTMMNYTDIQCNGWTDGGVIGSSPAPLYATATAGSTVTLQWTDWPDSHIGPIITYMAKVPSGSDVTSWMPGSSAVWFKIDEAGLDLSTNTWAAIKLISDGNRYSFTIPSSLAAGQYIIRHEIIALHSSYTYPGAQSYPSCIQVQITGSGSVTPSGSNVVAFPGAYDGTTAGLVWPLWNPNNLQSGVAYPIPGPSLYFGSGSASSTTTSKAASSTTTTKASTTTTTTTTSKPASTTTTTKASTTTTTTKASTTTTTKTSTTTTKTSTTSSSSTSAAAAYAQCGGSGWTGATTCVSGYTCTYSNAYYSQCVPS